VIAQGRVAEISGATLWRWLSSDALRLGNIAVGSFRAIPISPTALVQSSTSTIVFGKAFRWALTTL
jgi:hypothetical protein